MKFKETSLLVEGGKYVILGLALSVAGLVLGSLYCLDLVCGDQSKKRRERYTFNDN